MTDTSARTYRSTAWTLVLFALIALRLPAMARPVGGDQSLYLYDGHRLAQGDVPYRDVWDQKPPGIFGVYGAIQAAVGTTAAVPIADFLITALVAGSLLRLGRRIFGGRAGELAAFAFLVLGDPGIARLGGMNLRAQCESFVALAITAALMLVWRDDNRRWHLAAAGACLALAFWLKYNAAVFALPILAAVVLGINAPAGRRRAVHAIAWIGGVAAGLSTLVVVYFALNQALTDLWLATITYNVRYSAETYAGAVDMLRYAGTLPFLHAYVDGLWFVGLLGAVVMIGSDRRTVVVLAWIAAAVLSIAINGSRGLPQYFVQAAPALALAAGAGLDAVWRQRGIRSWLLPSGVAILLLVGAWRVGVEPGPWYQPRLFGIPQAAANVADDMRYLTGRMSRDEYLTRFDKEGGKYSPPAIDRLVRTVTNAKEVRAPLYVFGFASGAVLVQAGAESASRFFWSRPVVLEFAAERPGYGSAGLLADLQRNPPSIVALQKQDWGILRGPATEPDSLMFFMNTPPLRSWLEAHYAPDYDDGFFAVWRRKTS